MYLNALGQPIIVINSFKAASELLDRRASIYSDHPRQIVAHEILCGGLASAFMPYGDLLVFTLSSEVSGLTMTFLVGVACAARSMKCSQRPQFLIITQLFPKRPPSSPLQFSRIRQPWTSLSNAPLLLLSCLSYMIIPPLGTNAMRQLRKSTRSSNVRRQLLLPEHILLSSFLG